jgi:hypothetical protein
MDGCARDGILLPRPIMMDTPGSSPVSGSINEAVQQFFQFLVAAILVIQAEISRKIR